MRHFQERKEVGRFVRRERLTKGRVLSILRDDDSDFVVEEGVLTKTQESGDVLYKARVQREGAKSVTKKKKKRGKKKAIVIGGGKAFTFVPKRGSNKSEWEKNEPRHARRIERERGKGKRSPEIK